MERRSSVGRWVAGLAVAVGVAACAEAPVAPGLEPGEALAVKGFPAFQPQPSAVTSGIEAVWGSAADNVFTVGLSGTIQHFDGSRWVHQESGTTSSLRAIWGSGPADIWAVGGLGALLHYDGSGWRLVTRLRSDSGTQFQLYGLWGNAADDIWAVGNSGTSHHYDGESWTYHRLPSSEIFRGVWGTGRDNVYAVGGGGAIVHFDGEAWSAVESPTGTRLNTIHGRGPNDIFAAGTSGEIIHYDGTSWKIDPQARVITRAHIRDMWSDQAGNIFAVAWGGTVLLHDGKEWHQLTSGTGSNLEGIWSSRNGRIVAGGQGGLVLHGGRGNGNGGRPPGQEQAPIWPLSGTPRADGDSVHSQYGPRYLPRGYDFHAGIDLPAPRGTPVLSVLDGVVIVTSHYTGSGSAGNTVIVRHESGEATAYLHLNSIDVEVGDFVEQGHQIGTVGSTGASYPHLHLGYFRTLNTDAINEQQSFNPLEILAYRNPPRIGAEFSEGGVVLSMPLQSMTVRKIAVHGEGQTREIDYYEIVRQGSSNRDAQLQNGIWMDTGRASGGRFDLILEPVEFQADRVVVTDFAGKTVLDAKAGR